MSGAERDPYKLFDYYTFEDHDLFFGREDEVFRMVGEVLSSRLLVLFSQSGSGKTSLINAGVRPALERHGPRTVYVRLEKDPETAIREAIANDPVHGFPEFKDIAPTDSLHADLCALYAKLKRDAEESANAVEMESRPTVPSLVIFMDQFEEFFLVFNAEVRQRFIKQLAEIRYDQNLPVLVVLSLRDDYFVQLNEFREDIPSIFQNNANIQLGSLSRESAQMALVEPAKACGATFDADLVDRLLKDLAVESAASLGRARLLPSRSGNEADSQPNGSAGASPSQQAEPTEVSPIILQIVAHTLWRERGSESTITTATYERLGAAKGILGRHLQAALNSVKPRPISLMQRLFQALMTPEQTKRFRSRSSLISLVRVLSTRRFDRLLEQLVNAHLLRKEDRNGEAWYEFRHDYLVPKLREWIESQLTKFGRTRWIIRIVYAFMLPVYVVIWKYTHDYRTFEARFADRAYVEQRQEVIITRRWEPPWTAEENQFRQGTWIFKDECLDYHAENKLGNRFQLNVGEDPDWSPLVPLLAYTRRSLAEQEWLSPPISVPSPVVSSLHSAGRGRDPNESGTDGVMKSLVDQASDVCSGVTASFAQQGNSDAHVIEALVAYLKHQDGNVRANFVNSIGLLGQKRSDWTDERMLADLADNDSLVRERAGIVLAYRHQQVGDNRPDPQVVERIKLLRKDHRPWVKQAALHALYHIEKRKAELEEEAQKANEPKSLDDE